MADTDSHRSLLAAVIDIRTKKLLSLKVQNQPKIHKVSYARQIRMVPERNKKTHHRNAKAELHSADACS